MASRIRCASPPASGAGGPVERQVVQAHVDQELQPVADLLQQPLGDHVLALGELQLVEEGDASSRIDSR